MASLFSLPTELLLQIHQLLSAQTHVRLALLSSLSRAEYTANSFWQAVLLQHYGLEHTWSGDAPNASSPTGYLDYYAKRQRSVRWYWKECSRPYYRIPAGWLPDNLDLKVEAYCSMKTYGLEEIAAVYQLHHGPRTCPYNYLRGATGSRGVDQIMEDIFGKLTPKPAKMIKFWRRNCRHLFVVKTSSGRWYLAYICWTYTKYGRGPLAKSWAIYFGGQSLHDRFDRSSGYLQRYPLPARWTFPEEYAFFLNEIHDGFGDNLLPDRSRYRSIYSHQWASVLQGWESGDGFDEGDILIISSFDDCYVRPTTDPAHPALRVWDHESHKETYKPRFPEHKSESFSEMLTKRLGELIEDGDD